MSINMDQPIHSGADYCNEDYFNPKAFLTNMYPKEEDADAWGFEVRKLNLKWIDTFAELSTAVKGRRLCDFGCGPSLNVAIPSSRCFEEIYMCEYGAQNRQAVQDWIDNKPAAYDWTSFLRQTAEREGGGVTPKDVERRVRQKIKGIFPCDIHSDNPFHPKVFNPGFFDCITSCFCLDSACSTEVDYRAAVNKLATYLKAGGQIMMSGVLEESFYTVGGRTFRSLVIHTGMIEGSLRDAGLRDINIETTHFTPDPSKSDCKGFYFVKASKC